MPDQELSGKVAIVTGAGRLRGIGRAAAMALAQLGCDVVVTGTGRDPATFPADEKLVGWGDVESTAVQVRSLGRRCLTQIGDVSNSNDVQRMFDAAISEFGHVDILVNNSASARGADRVPVVELGEELSGGPLR
ncbi:MAG: SDR family NAD(P)-dependent oxidoreductase [Dehalococcoidia bacterium]|nr:SDR family NAD(P)-dependent oxidoreductase [Dehalococcoidia bacterium]